MAKTSSPRKKRVKFEFRADPGSTVHVAGSFNGWSPTESQMIHEGNSYTTTLLLPRGRHEYKFVVDGIWRSDPECPEWAPNDKGSLNSVIAVA